MELHVYILAVFANIVDRMILSKIYLIDVDNRYYLFSTVLFLTFKFDILTFNKEAQAGEENSAIITLLVVNVLICRYRGKFVLWKDY